jgi:hypothetical protein
MCAQIYIPQFKKIEDSFQKFFHGILPIDKNGVFQPNITLAKAEELLQAANRRWTGEKLTAAEKN